MPHPFNFKQGADGSFDCYDDLNRSNISIRGIIDLIVKHHKEQAATAPDDAERQKWARLAAEWERFAAVMAESKTKDEFISNSREMFPRLIESFLVWHTHR